jgi:hypothetical protein
LAAAIGGLSDRQREALAEAVQLIEVLSEVIRRAEDAAAS